ncbi:MAG: hypothetical protein K9L31_03230, partial [Candidatus Pacebacteria bacterium]|nr:hypothetical protein [Candidatus Paceibacterota bacterium]
MTFGDEEVFNEETTAYTSVFYLDSTHFVVAYRDYGNSYYGTAIVGTVASDGSITYGPEYVFNSASTDHIPASALDSTHFVVAYRDNGNNGYG